MAILAGKASSSPINSQPHPPPPLNSRTTPNPFTYRHNTLVCQVKPLQPPLTPEPRRSTLSSPTATNLMQRNATQRNALKRSIIRPLRRFDPNHLSPTNSHLHLHLSRRSHRSRAVSTPLLPPVRFTCVGRPLCEKNIAALDRSHSCTPIPPLHGKSFCDLIHKGDVHGLIFTYK